MSDETAVGPGDPVGPHAVRGLLEVAVTHPRDVPGCVEGGADRLAVVAPGASYATAPEPALVSAVARTSGLPVRALLRLPPADGTAPYSADPASLDRLADLAREYLALGAEGVVLGFLDADLEVDVRACRELLAAVPGTPWTFHRALDDTLDPGRSWGRVVDLPGVTAVRSGGSPQGLAQGYEDLLALARRSPEVARLLMPAGGLAAEHVPWFVRAGVHQVHLGTQVRPGASYRSYVDAGYVRSWRRLLDDAVDRDRRSDRAGP